LQICGEFNNISDPFDENVIEFPNGDVKNYVSLDRIGDEAYRSSYKIKYYYCLKDIRQLDQYDRDMVVSFVSSPENSSLIANDTKKFTIFLGLVQYLETNILVRKALEFLLAGTQEIISDSFFSKEVARQLKSVRNLIAHQDILMENTKNALTLIVRYASIYCKAVLPQLINGASRA